MSGTADLIDCHTACQASPLLNFPFNKYCFFFYRVAYSYGAQRIKHPIESTMLCLQTQQMYSCEFVRCDLWLKKTAMLFASTEPKGCHLLD